MSVDDGASSDINEMNQSNQKYDYLNQSNNEKMTRMLLKAVQSGDIAGVLR